MVKNLPKHQMLESLFIEKLNKNFGIEPRVFVELARKTDKTTRHTVLSRSDIGNARLHKLVHLLNVFSNVDFRSDILVVSLGTSNGEDIIVLENKEDVNNFKTKLFNYFYNRFDVIVSGVEPFSLKVWNAPKKMISAYKKQRGYRIKGLFMAVTKTMGILQEYFETSNPRMTEVQVRDMFNCYCENLNSSLVWNVCKSSYTERNLEEDFYGNMYEVVYYSATLVTKIFYLIEHDLLFSCAVRAEVGDEFITLASGANPSNVQEWLWLYLNAVESLLSLDFRRLTIDGVRIESESYGSLVL